VKSYLILNLRSMNDLPLMERWLLKEHAAETLSMNGPILDRYVSYRAVPPPEGAESFGYYNWRMTEHWWRSAPFGDDPLDQGTSFSEIWPENYTSILGLPAGEARSAKWSGGVTGAHPPVQVFLPRRPSEDFKGKGLTMHDGTVLRWVVALRYPPGVTREQGDEWYRDVHAPEVCKQPGLKRFFSFKVIDPVTGPFVRVSELWYENANAWRKAILEAPPRYTMPPWAKYGRFPFLEPYVDFIGTFILEAPSDDFKHNFRGYVFTA
jgi:hypothetical protein